MNRKRKWTIDQLRNAAKKSCSIRHVLLLIGLREASGNYEQIKKYLLEYQIDTSHFTEWHGIKVYGTKATPLSL
jgi:hypothetical protein